ncbi:MAG: hypothetical protein ACLFPE_02060 [Bacteroidales bacterium]
MLKIAGLFLFLYLMPGARLVMAQQYLVLEKAGTTRNFKYQTRNTIMLQLKNSDSWIAGDITEIRDSAIIIDHFIEIDLHNIAVVRRSSGFLKALSNLFFLRGGAAYLLIAGTNRTINHEYPVVDTSTMIVSGSLMAAGLLIKPLIRRDFLLGEKWRLKILDFSVFE